MLMLSGCDATCCNEENKSEMFFSLQRTVACDCDGGGGGGALSSGQIPDAVGASWTEVEDTIDFSSNRLTGLLQWDALPLLWGT